MARGGGTQGKGSLLPCPHNSAQNPEGLLENSIPMARPPWLATEPKQPSAWSPGPKISMRILLLHSLDQGQLQAWSDWAGPTHLPPTHSFNTQGKEPQFCLSDMGRLEATVIIFITDLSILPRPGALPFLSPALCALKAHGNTHKPRVQAVLLGPQALCGDPLLQ